MPGLFDKLLGKDIASRVQSLQYLGNMDSATSVPKLVKAMGDEPVEVRRAASGALEQHSRTGDKKAMAALMKGLSDPDAVVRQNSALALGEFALHSKDKADVDAARVALIALIAMESDEGVIKKAVISLANQQDRDLICPMVDAFRPKNKKTIVMAIDAINDLPPTDIRLEMKKVLRSIL